MCIYFCPYPSVKQAFTQLGNVVTKHACYKLHVRCMITCKLQSHLSRQKAIRAFQNAVVAVTCLQHLVTLYVHISYVGEFIKSCISSSKLAGIWGCHISALPVVPTNVELIACMFETIGLMPCVTGYELLQLLPPDVGRKTSRKYLLH